MALLDLRGGGRFLYEVLPGLFPESQMTETELLLWEFYYRDKNERLAARK